MRCARTLAIPVVGPAWLVESAAAGGLLPVEAYLWQPSCDPAPWKSPDDKVGAAEATPRSHPSAPEPPPLGVCFLPSLPIVSRFFGFFVGGFGDLHTPTSGFLLSTLGLSLAAGGAVAPPPPPTPPPGARRARTWLGRELIR